jgi:hypothetical protein
MKLISLHAIIIGITATVVMTFISSCASADAEKTQQSMSDNSRKATVAPGQCRIIGRIVNIQPVSVTASKDSPCSKVPCKAVVSVQKILGYGAGFSNPLTEGKEITLNFVFTLSPTKEYFPSLSEHLPGLSVGDSFSGSIESTNTAGEYKLYSYTKDPKE